MARFVFDKVENIAGKEENTGYQHFLLFQQCFQKVSFVRIVNSRDYVVKGERNKRDTIKCQIFGKTMQG